MCFYFLYFCLIPPTHMFIGIKLFIMKTLMLPHHDLFKIVIYNLFVCHEENIPKLCEYLWTLLVLPLIHFNIWEVNILDINMWLDIFPSYSVGYFTQTASGPPPTQRHTDFEICESRGFTPAYTHELPSVLGLGRLPFMHKDILHIISSCCFISNSSCLECIRL